MMFSQASNSLQIEMDVKRFSGNRLRSTSHMPDVFLTESYIYTHQSLLHNQQILLGSLVKGSHEYFAMND